MVFFWFMCWSKDESSVIDRLFVYLLKNCDTNLIFVLECVIFSGKSLDTFSLWPIVFDFHFNLLGVVESWLHRNSYILGAHTTSSDSCTSRISQVFSIF